MLRARRRTVVLKVSDRGMLKVEDVLASSRFGAAIGWPACCEMSVAGRMKL